MIVRSPSSLLVGCSLALGLALTNVRDADACGGCFHPEPKVIVSGSETTSVVTDHRMVFKVSQNETILWDQVRYTGAPEEFAWVLPVRDGAKVELSRDEFIASLDAVTKTSVKGPTRTCRDPNSNQSVTFNSSSPSGGGGCGGSDDEASFASAPKSENSAGGGNASLDAGSENEDVSVISQSVIGPYQSVTLHANNGEGISEWLETNKFQIPDNVKPVIDAYTKEGFDFIALRLRPGQGVQAMRPVRVVTPGADTTLPLRMVAAGIGAKVGLTLWVIAEGRYEAQNFPNGTVDETAIKWDAKAGRSNLTTLQQDLMAGNDGRTWLTEVSSTQVFEGNAAQVFTSGKSLYSRYTSSCITVPPHLEPCNAHELPPSNGSPDDLDGGADGGSDSGAKDAGAPSKCTKLVSGCDDYDDLEVASRGLHSGDAWVTRLRADLPAKALSDDFRLTATSQTRVSNEHTTNTYLDPNDDPCPDGVYRGPTASSGTPASSRSAPPPEDDSSCTCRVQKKANPGTWLLIGVTAFVAARIARRKRG
ncbi:MAG: DUF2330 domain-containing protein [Labilithrix sp.]